MDQETRPLIADLFNSLFNSFQQSFVQNRTHDEIRNEIKKWKKYKGLYCWNKSHAEMLVDKIEWLQGAPFQSDCRKEIVVKVMCQMMIQLYPLDIDRCTDEASQTILPEFVMNRVCSKV